MCFALYAGTTNPLPLRAFEPGSADLPVQALGEDDEIVKTHFTSPHVQFVGSSSGCGCDFPHATSQGGGWSYFDDPTVEESTNQQLNCERLVGLLLSTGDPLVELYGVWEGDFRESPAAREDITLDSISEIGFRFKERGFYKVIVSQL